MNKFSLDKLQILNFRNLSDNIFSFSPKINLIYGKNGNGKTNLLESIYFIAHKKSFKSKTKFSNLLSVDCEKPQILLNSVFKNNEKMINYNLILTDKKQIWNQGKKRSNKLCLNAVIINPFDSFLFYSKPSFRRVFFDNCIEKLSIGYKEKIKNYTILLKNRNKLLLDKPFDFQNQINAIDKNLSELSEYLTFCRIKFIKEIKFEYEKVFFKLFSKKISIEIQISSRFKDLKTEEIYKYYRGTFESDCLQRKTSYGVHLDDYEISMNGLDMISFASIGQQKVSFLSLQFAYIELFRYKLQAYPMVLIDDVSGELDEQRWDNLLSYIMEKDFQVFITSANKNFVEDLRAYSDTKYIEISNGKII